MIRYFKRIRHKLFTENKFTKYLLYAIGEIILVVIGILIALQLNNRNELLKKQREEQIILHDLKGELLDNKKVIHTAIADYNSILRRSSEILSMIESKKYDLPPHTLDTILEAFIFPPTYNPFEGVINTISSSGKLSLIQNKEITYRLTTIKGITADFRYWAGIDKTNVRNFNTPFIMDKYPVKSLLRDVFNEPPSKFKRNAKALFEDVKMESLTELRRVNSIVIIEKLKKVELKQNELINLIQKELKTK